MITSPFIPVKQDEFDGIGEGVGESLAHTRTCFGLCDPVRWESGRVCAVRTG
jgi:hypothetical protein